MVWEVVWDHLDDQLTMEREKRFELSTSTLARLHSTTELLPRGEALFRWVGGVCQQGNCAETTSINVGAAWVRIIRDGRRGPGACGGGFRCYRGCLDGAVRARAGADGVVSCERAGGVYAADARRRARRVGGPPSLIDVGGERRGER